MLQSLSNLSQAVFFFRPAQDGSALRSKEFKMIFVGLIHIPGVFRVFGDKIYIILKIH